MKRYLTGIVMVIAGFILLIIIKGKDFNEVEQSWVISLFLLNIRSYLYRI
ncbi:hypothetical protein [Bacillus massilinigeriensis]|nr:hypothetical protein [Bacillus massilionigeriensis]